MDIDTSPPWTIEPWGGMLSEGLFKANLSVMSGPWSVCMVQADNGKDAAANARLIAAAPELLEALQTILDYHTTSKPWNAKEGDMSVWIKAARAAIAKATGAAS